MPIYTNYLGDMIGERSPTLEDVGQWEAVITFCAYISRLNYDLKPRKILESFKYLTFSPIVFNTVLGYLGKMNLKSELPHISPETPISGHFIYDKEDDLPLSITMFDYSKGQCKFFPNEKILVIGFRGTLSLKTGMKDLNMVAKPLSLIFNDLPASSYGEGKAHGGFINGMKNVFFDIVSRINDILKENPDISRILVTGHSLGGGYANLCGLGLANLKKNGEQYPKINIITFGAPKTFSESGRDIFNELLKGNFMTLDRVVYSSYMPDPLVLTTDIIPALPNHLYHPGFTLTTMEKYKFSSQGRSRHVANTRKRAGLKRNFSLLRMTGRDYNPLPYYPEFFSKFNDSALDPDFTNKDYQFLITSSPNGRVYTGLTHSAKKVLAIVKRILNISPQEIHDIGVMVEKEDDIAGEVAAKESKSESGDPSYVAALEQEKQTEGQAAANLRANNSSVPANLRGNNSALVKGGAYFGTSQYSKETRNYHPNEIVYSCSLITTPISPVPLPPVQCHLGYMGVGWLGVGSAIVPLRDREFLRYAVVYNINGKFVYVSDKNTPKSGNSPNQSGGKRLKATRKIKR